MSAGFRFLFKLILIWLLKLIPVISILLIIVILLHLRRLLLLLILEIIICLLLLLLLLLLTQYLREIFKILQEIASIKRHVRLIINVDIVIRWVLLEIYIGILLRVLWVLFGCVHCLVHCTEDSVHEIIGNTVCSLLVVLLGIVLSASHFWFWFSIRSIIGLCFLI